MALENIFGAPPEYLSGLLGVDPEKLRKQAFGTGLVNTALAFAAQPRNQGYGSVLPYAARALMAGQQGAQGVYQGALQDYMTKQKIEEIKRQQQQEQLRQSAISQFAIDNPNLATAAQAFPEAVIPQVALKSLEGKKRDVKEVGGNLIDISGETPTVIYESPKELKAAPTRDIQQGRTRITQELQPDGTWKEIARGSMDAPRQDEAVSYKVETDATGKVVYIPNKPGYAIVDQNFKPTTYTPKDANKAPSEGERKSATLLSRMEGSLKQLNKALEEKETAASPNIVSESFRLLPFGAGEFAANLAQSPQRQRVEAAQLDIVDAALTLGTGAAYTREQLEGYRKSYFPVLGDSPETIKDKQDRLDALIKSARIAAGALSEKVPSGGFVNSEKQNILSKDSKIPVKISSDADYNNLPSGSEFIGPDGKLRRKP